MSKDDDSFTEGKLFQPEAPQYRCGSCRDTGKWSNGIVCPPCGGASVQTEAPKSIAERNEYTVGDALGLNRQPEAPKCPCPPASDNDGTEAPKGCCCDGTQTYCPEHGEFEPGAPKGQEHTEHDLETVVAAVETILTKYELSHDETNDYVESIMRVVWCQKEGDYERKQYVSTLQRDLAAANARADAAERKLASLTNQTAGARYLINAFDENSLSPVEVIEVMRKVFK
jgi:hypothetical protein